MTHQLEIFALVRKLWWKCNKYKWF